MRVLLVTHYFPPHVGGIENVAWQQARHLAELGVEVTVLTSGDESSTRFEGDFRVVRVRAWNGLERRAGVPFPVLGRELWRAARHWADWADVVHVHDCLYMTSWAAGRAAERTGTPLVMTQHVAVVDHPVALVGAVQRIVYRAVGSGLLRRSRNTAVVNGTVAEFVRSLGTPPSRVRLVPNGVDTAMFHPATPSARAALRAELGLPADAVLVLFVGRPVPKKGYQILLDAAHPDYQLVFAGERPAHTQDRPGVHHLGQLTPTRLADVYQACDIFALPSTAEGFPLTVQEAMASGLPVVTTDDPGYGIYELDRAKVHLVRRDAAEVRAALVGLANDGATRRVMAGYAVDYATRRFSWAAHTDTLLCLYHDAMRSTVDRLDVPS
jgi:glycosyltransferase involved in cell wall biosynthesis